MAKLVYTDQGEELEYTLDSGRASITIGRNPMCDLRINNPSISRKHAEIRVDAASGGYSIYDLNSSNGTYVNGKRESSSSLAHGDELLCGEFKIFFYSEGAGADDGPYTPSAPILDDGFISEADVPGPFDGPVNDTGSPDATAAPHGGTPKASPSPLGGSDELAELRAERESLSTALANANQRAQLAESEADDLRAELDRLTQQNAELQEALGDLSAELGALVEANETLIAQVGASN